jgi:uncharacterized protein YndB with AHSA1/START domain
MTIDLNASPADVWNALTKADELVRWFPLNAKVDPGEGGSMTWSWGDMWTGTMRIDAWKPERLLRLVDEQARPYDVEGGQLAAGETSAARVALEITLETHEGKTRLRLVHSGFGHGASWDDEIDGVSTGWQFELRSLRHYLEHHRGPDRRTAWAHSATSQPIAEVWSRLVSADGFAIDAAELAPGAAYAVKSAAGDRFSGTIELFIPGREFFGRAAELGDGVFRLSAYPGGGKTGVTVWAATYDKDGNIDLRAVEQRAQATLDTLFHE